MCTIIKINSPNKCVVSSKKNYLNDFNAIFRYYNRTGADEDNLVIVCDQCMLSLLVGPRLHHTWTYFDLWTLWRCLVKAELVPTLSVSLLWQNLQIAECFKFFAFTSWNSTWSLKPNFIIADCADIVTWVEQVHVRRAETVRWDHAVSCPCCWYAYDVEVQVCCVAPRFKFAFAHVLGVGHQTILCTSERALDLV